MEKLFAGLYIVIIVLSFSCGFLLLHINDLQNQNSTLEDEISAYQSQIGKLENQTSELEDQIDELEKQIEDLQEQIFQKKLADAKQVEIIKVERSEDIHDSWFVQMFNVYATIKNRGTKDVNVDGLVLSIGSGEPNPSSAKPVGVLKAGETKTVGLGGVTIQGPFTGAVVTLWFNDVKIDTKQLDY